METATIVKTAGMGIGGAGVIGATGYGAYTMMQPTNIEEKLKSNGKDVLPTDVSNTEERKVDWEKLVKEYEAATNGDKIDGLTLSAPSDSNRAENIKQLKGKCSELLKTKLSEDSDSSKYNKAEKWCTKKSEQTQES